MVVWPRAAVAEIERKRKEWRYLGSHGDLIMDR